VRPDAQEEVLKTSVNIAIFKTTYAQPSIYCRYLTANKSTVKFLIVLKYFYEI
jgi:hypothetical protein